MCIASLAIPTGARVGFLLALKIQMCTDVCDAYSEHFHTFHSEWTVQKGSIYHYTNEQTLCALQMVNSGRIAAIFLPGKEFSGNIKIAQYDQWAAHSQGLIIPHQLLLNSCLC